MKSDLQEAQRPKEDRRVARTRRALREALLALIDEKGYAAVTVEEITARANLGRATFYLHYKDKEELLLEQLGELANERAAQLSSVPISAWMPGGTLPLLPLLSIFEHAAENMELYQIVLCREGHFHVVDRLRGIIAVTISKVIEAISANEAPSLRLSIPVDLLAAYFSGALLGSIRWWLEQEPDQRPSAHQMALDFQTLFIPGVRELAVNLSA